MSTKQCVLTVLTGLALFTAACGNDDNNVITRDLISVDVRRDLITATDTVGAVDAGTDAAVATDASVVIDAAAVDSGTTATLLFNPKTHLALKASSARALAPSEPGTLYGQTLLGAGTYPYFHRPHFSLRLTGDEVVQ